nr:RNA-dependent RNA polymerase [Bunyavirales sp.]
MSADGLDIDDQLIVNKAVDLAYNIFEFSDGNTTVLDMKDKMVDRSHLDLVKKQLSEFSSQSSIRRSDDDLPVISKRKLFRNKCIIRLESGIVKLVSDEIVNIGHTNCKYDLTIELSCDPSENMSQSLPLACSCLTNRSKSSSPSQILHNTVVISLAKSILNYEMMIERQAKYTPDLLVRHEKGDICIDVTGSSTRLKLSNVSKYYSGILIIINKYSFITDESPPRIQMLAKWSKLVDHCDIDYMYKRANEQSSHFDCSPLNSIKTMKFFKTGIDSLGRTIEDHHNVAMKQLMSRASKVTETNPNTSLDIKPLIDEISKIIDQPLKCEKYFPYAGYHLNSYPNGVSANFDPKTLYHTIEPNNVSSTILDYKLDVLWENMETGDIDKEGRKQLFEIIRSISVHEKAYQAAVNYAAMKQANDVESAKYMLFLAHILGGVPQAVRAFFMSRVSMHTNYYLDSQGVIRMKTRNLDASRKLKPCPAFKGIQFTMNQLRIGALSIDPDHHNLCFKMDCKAAIAHLAMSTLYHNLRFKARIATAILLNHKPDSCMRVSHYDNDLIHAEVKTSGLVLDSDRGVCMVSFFHNNILLRSEKWRLSDIENYSINHHRYVSMVVSLYKQKIESTTRIEMCDLYGSLLMENSWGISRFYKVFKYLTYGCVAGSINSATSIKKLLSQIDDSFKAKLSTYIFSSILIRRHKLGLIQPGRTLLFGLDFSLMSYELYLVNLCPQNTYGRKKHLTDTMDELIEETKLYESNYSLIKDVHQSFDDLLDSTNLDESYLEYFDKVETISFATGGRFTGTPLCIVLMNQEIENLDYRRLDVISQMPHLSDLLTARASYDPRNHNCSFAANTMSKLALEFNTDSTSLLAINLLNDRALVDLTMRMFDKNQVGGNREISILSNEFRILQIVVESFFKGIGMLTDNEMLNRKERYDDMMKIFEKTTDSDGKLMCSIDQTRWGPNFNTSLFGLMALSMSRFTTEAYLPSLICFMSEFKVFEIPPWLHRLTTNLTSSYSLPGVLGRSHMAQGIFHNTSSVYHSLLTTMFGKMVLDSARSDNPEIDSEGFNLKFDSLITSDDCSMAFSVHLPLKYKMNKLLKSEFNIILEDLLTAAMESIKSRVNNYKHIVKFFGIKTSEYKNIISSDFFEFNSLYLSNMGISEPNLKFLYALIEPQTTGNFLQDYSNLLNSYYTSLNCGVSEVDSILICYANYLRFCRQWLIRADITGFPSIETMRYGLMPSLLLANTDRNHMNLMRTKSYLRHKSRKVYEDVKAYYSTTLSEAYVDLAIKSIDGSRAQNAHRSCITYYQGNRHILTDSQMYKLFNCYGESFTSFLRNNNGDPTHSLRCYNTEVEVPYFYSSENYMTEPKKRFAKVHLKRTKMSNLCIESLLVSLEPAKNTIRHNDSDDDFMRHMIRDAWIGEIVDPIIIEQCKGLPLADQVISLTSLVCNLYLNVGTCSRYVFNPTGKSIGYRSVIISPPITQINFDFTLNCYIDTKLPNLKGNVANVKDYCSQIIVASNGSISQKETVGNYQYDNTVRTPYLLGAPTLDDIISTICNRYVTINREYIKPGSKYYLNLLIDTREQDKVDKPVSKKLAIEDMPDDDDDFLGMLGGDPYAGANDNLLNLIDCLESNEEREIEASEESDIEERVNRGAKSIVQSMMSDVVINMSADNPLFKMISLEVCQDSVLYTESYGLCRLITNWYLNRLLDLSILQSSSRERGYILELIRSGKMKVYCTDKELPHKINQMVRHISARFQIDYANSVQEVKHFLYALASGDPLVDEQNNIMYKTPLLLCSSLYTISTKPQGELKPKNEVMNVILDERFLPLLFR